MASSVSWGGLPFLTPSPTCYKYLRGQTKVVPERSIRIGARYRARKNLAEHVRNPNIIIRFLHFLKKKKTV